jgi:hypothetical protein
MPAAAGEVRQKQKCCCNPVKMLLHFEILGAWVTLWQLRSTAAFQALPDRQLLNG